MRLPNAAHEAHPWAIARIASDFRLLDVWALPAEGKQSDFPAFIETMSSFDPAASGNVASKLLFAIRSQLGAVLGWDEEKERSIPGCKETSLRDRLPDRLRDSVAGEDAAGGFTPVYRTDDEWAAELSNATVHGVLHLGWVEREGGRYGAQLGVYVKPRGRTGQAYLALIAPFRHLVVYPALMRQIEQAWTARTLGVTT